MTTREQVLGMAGLISLRSVGSREETEKQWSLARSLAYEAEQYHPVADVSEFTPLAGYAEWADDYDEPDNPFFSLQERYFFPRLVQEKHDGKILDVAGGTGRIATLFTAEGQNVLVLDRSPAMLQKAAGNRPKISAGVADYRALPIATSSIDLVVCSLALTHAPDLMAAVSEFARVVAASGRIIICDVHPTATLLGWQAFFQMRSGGTAFVRNYPHSFSDYIFTFASTHLQVQDLTEIKFDSSSLRIIAPDNEHFTSAVVGAFAGLPALVMWTLIPRPAVAK